MSHDNTFWQTKLAARIHDPAEKALVLLRDPVGHEGGSIVEIGRQLGFATRRAQRKDGYEYHKLKLDPDMEKVIKQADQWAASTDRAQFPMDRSERYVDWARVQFGEEGQLIHPLSGERLKIHKIGQQVLAESIRDESARVFSSLIQRDENGEPDHRLTALAFWRFGPELGKRIQGIEVAGDEDAGGPLASLGHLWNLLPADTRTPDHSIWQHLDLTSALAGAMTGGGRPALLTVSIGPVQDFIAAGRSTSDLWAGSHFLAMVAWRAMRVVAERLGPDAILFPQLRGVPVVDLWLIEQGLDPEMFEHTQWHDTRTDYNPLFAAALPNRFVAIVPEPEGANVAEQVQRQVRTWVVQQGRKMLELVLNVLKGIGEQPEEQYCFEQLKKQLAGFPEVHWSLAPWTEAEGLEAALQPFYPEDDQRPGMFGSKTWELLTAEIRPEQDWRFWDPNDGTLYAAVYDLGDRALAAAKSVRPFDQSRQEGFRDSLSGEWEWLTLDKDRLNEGSPRRRTDTLWAQVAKEKPRWSKGDPDGRKAEHLSAFGLIKRLWPDHFIDLIRQSRWHKKLPDHSKPGLGRYVVSTHVMALAPSMEELMRDGPASGDKARAAWQQLVEQAGKAARPALPRRLMSGKYRGSEYWDVASKLPDLIEKTREEATEDAEADQIEQVLKRIETAAGHQAERYYALLLMDGDKLGAWLSGKHTLKGRQSFHSRVRGGLERYEDERLKRYLEEGRLVSAARHMAISSALNGFALDLVRHVVEDKCLGKVLYAGGDDVMAMVSVRDLLKGMVLLRAVYSGGLPADSAMQIDSTSMKLERGFVTWQGRLYQTMGTRATASAGAVIAHHQAPLAAVMRELREAEKRAKNEGGRNAFAITIVKRSGGALYLTAKWGCTMDALRAAIAFLRRPGVSRRAVYHTQLWLKDLPPASEHEDMLGALLGYQLARQAERANQEIKDQAANLGAGLARLAAGRPGDGRKWLENFLSVAEFLAREIRGGEDSETSRRAELAVEETSA